MINLGTYQHASFILNMIDAGYGHQIDLKESLSVVQNYNKGQRIIIPLTKKNLNEMRKVLHDASGPIPVRTLYRGSGDSFWPVILGAYMPTPSRNHKRDKIPPWMRVQHQETMERLFDLGFPVKITHWLSTSRSKQIASEFARKGGYIHVIHIPEEARGVVMPTNFEREVVLEPGGWLVPVKRQGNTLTWKWVKKV